MFLSTLKGVFYEEVYYYVSLSVLPCFSALYAREYMGKGLMTDLETKVDEDGKDAYGVEGAAQNSRQKLLMNSWL